MNKWREAISFQQRSIATLGRQRFEVLAARPEQEEIKLEPPLRGIRCFIHRRAGAHGGVQISVEVRQRLLFILMTSSEDGFEIFPDGRMKEL
jgi:hypothetical protein